MQLPRAARYSILAAIAAIYLLLRLWGLTAGCLWFDEIFGVHAAEHDWGEMFSFIALDLIHPPLFYIALKAWMAIAGDGLLWLRLFSIAWSAAAIAPFLALCRELSLSFTVRAAAFFLLAVNGSLIKYAQEVRMYSMLMCLSLVSMWLFARLWSRKKGFGILLFINLLLIHTHYFGWFVVLAEALMLVLLRREWWRRALWLIAAEAAAFAPWLAAVIAASRSGSDVGQNIGWISRPGPADVFYYVLNLIEPIYHQASSIEPRSFLPISVPLLAAFCIVATAYFSADRAKNGNDGRLGQIYFPAMFILVPVIACFAVSWVSPFSVWGTRHLIATIPPATILSAILIDGAASRVLRLCVYGLIGIGAVLAIAINIMRPPQENVWCVWEPVGNKIGAIEATTEPPPRIFALEDLAAYHLWFAGRHNSRERVALLSGLPVTTNDKAYFLPRGMNDVERVALDSINDNSFWLVFRTVDRDEERRLIDEVTATGYVVCLKERRQIGTETIISVKFSKEADPCLVR
ncbi:MAG: glycosyltransferase family 39 protein [Acidobacteria bacterium]|nr:glycosyltransferase family 39 protein [Acidobacteriota bacterium]MCW5949502.1 glycosyltransferase family 39 protein [Pyrinomonadaceae bacterium]